MKMHFVFAALVLLAAADPYAQAQFRRTAKSNTPAATTAPNNTLTALGDPNGKIDYRNSAADSLIPAEADKRKPTTGDLQATVVELPELFHESKQNHWNLRGPLYLPIHEKLRENADDYRKYTDLLAERILQVGNPVDSRTGVVAATANLGEFPGGYLSDEQVLILMTERITTVAKRYANESST